MNYKQRGFVIAHCTKFHWTWLWGGYIWRVQLRWSGGPSMLLTRHAAHQESRHQRGKTVHKLRYDFQFEAQSALVQNWHPDFETFCSNIGYTPRPSRRRREPDYPYVNRSSEQRVWTISEGALVEMAVWRGGYCGMISAVAIEGLSSQDSWSQWLARNEFTLGQLEDASMLVLRGEPDAARMALAL